MCAGGCVCGTVCAKLVAGCCVCLVLGLLGLPYKMLGHFYRGMGGEVDRRMFTTWYDLFEGHSKGHFPLF